MQMFSSRTRIAPTALVLSMALLIPALAGGQVERLVVFGDSLSDPGNYFTETGDFVIAPYQPVPGAPYAIGGHHFSNGRTWIEQLASRLQLPASAGPAVRVPGVFTNYAFGRARARVGADFPLFDLSWQVEQFLDDHDGRGSADATYVIWIGGNDVRDALGSLAVDPTGATSTAILQGAIGSIADNIVALHRAGARDLLVLNAPNIGVTPAVRALGVQNPLIPVAAEQLSAGFNNGLSLALDSLQAVLPGLTMRRLDVFSLINGIVADPQGSGLIDASQPCLSFGVIDGAVCALPDAHLFWDGAHPTTAGHALVAKAAEQLLVAP